MPDGGVVAGGRFTLAGTTAVGHIARRVGSNWLPLGSGCNGTVDCLAVCTNGDIVAAGSFTTAGGVASPRLAYWNGTDWSTIGSVGGFMPVRALAVAASGDVIAAGQFSAIGGVPANNVARWDGSAWSSLGSGPSTGTGNVFALAVAANSGAIAAGGNFSGKVAIWDGTAWMTIGAGLVLKVAALAWLPDGRLCVAGGSLFGSSATAHCWDGVSWTPLGQMNDDIVSLAVLPDGDLIAAGSFVAAGTTQLERIARWDGFAWSALDTGLANNAAAMAVDRDGDVFVGGLFHAAGSKVSLHLARLSTNCPAMQHASGLGCGGAYVTANLAWARSSWQAEAGGLPNAALVAAVYGFQVTSLPLPLVFATALPGCTLHVLPDVVDLTTTTSGAASAGFVIPDNAALSGIAFRHQVVCIASDPGMTVTATNALTLTVGVF